MKIEKIWHVALVAVGAGILIAGLAGGTYYYVAGTQENAGQTILKNQSAPASVKSDTQELDAIESDLKQDDSSFDTTELEQSQKDLEIDLSGV